jgi:hypothetical protein
LGLCSHSFKEDFDTVVFLELVLHEVVLFFQSLYLYFKVGEVLMFAFQLHNSLFIVSFHFLQHGHLLPQTTDHE